MGNSLVIAVDFDGTVVEHKYPAIGKEMPFAFATAELDHMRDDPRQPRLYT